MYYLLQDRLQKQGISFPQVQHKCVDHVLFLVKQLGQRDNIPYLLLEGGVAVCQVENVPFLQRLVKVGLDLLGVVLISMCHTVEDVDVDLRHSLGERLELQRKDRFQNARLG